MASTLTPLPLCDDAPAGSKDGVPVKKLSRWMQFRRRLLVDIVLERWFDYSILVVVAANCVMLALDQPLDNPNSDKQVFIQKADKVRHRRGVGGGQ